MRQRGHSGVVERGLVMNKLMAFAEMLFVLVGTLIFGNCRAGVTYWVTNTGDSGPGSLRQVMIDANASAGVDTIAFNIPESGTQVILPDSGLPTVTDTVVIDGYTQPGTSPASSTTPAVLSILLDGTNASGLVDGLEIVAGGCTVRGLAIGNFTGNGISLKMNGGNRIQGNWIGASVDWVQCFRNWQSGIYIESNDNLVGGVEYSDPNTIGCNALDGVRVVAGTGNAILSNSICYNDLLGIDLGGDGVTENDTDDSDTGANNLQNSPTLHHVMLSSPPVVIGELWSTPSTTFRIEFFATHLEPIWDCEGRHLWGSTTVTTNSSGYAYISAEMSDMTVLESFASATAIDLSTNINDTSEFSECAGIPPPVELSSFSGISDRETVRLVWTTLSEDENLGFHLYRSSGEDAGYGRITDELIPGAGTTLAQHDYGYVDVDVEVGVTYYYKLADVDFEGMETMHGPVRVTVLPCEYRLLQNFPNPFRENTTVTLNLKADGHVRLLVHNLAGEQVALLVDEPLERGVHRIEWDGRDGAGHEMSSGVYTYTVEVNEFRLSRKMTLNR
jgi:hypothetical protein